jgi:putative lipoprotein (rSAM/lipoprotein system)
MKKTILFLLSLLGFSITGCYSEKYGAPYAEFELKGKVTDTLDNPIENIQIHVQEEYSMEKAYTDSHGNYFIETELFPDNNLEIKVKIEDIDGEENGGEFETQIITFPIKESDYINKGKKKDDWYEGKVSKEINFKLIQK